MLTLSETETLLSRYAGANNDFTSRLNEVRARLIQSGSYLKEEITLPVYADSAGHSIVSIPRRDTILAGAITTENVLCAGDPMGVRNGWSQFNKMGLGYGGLTNDFTEVFGEFAVFNEWSDPMRIRLVPDVSESGSVYLSGKLAGEDVWALNGVTWEKRELLTFSGSSQITSVKYYDAEGFRGLKPTTNGDVKVYTIDDDGVATLVAIWEAAETLPRYRRYRVPECEGVDPIAETSESSGGASSEAGVPAIELDAMFADADDITVNSTATTALTYAQFYLKSVRIIAQAGTYTHNFTLGALTPKKGAVLRLSLEVAASAGITLNFYNASTGGTLLQIVSGDSSGAYYATLVFSFNGTAWRYAGRET